MKSISLIICCLAVWCVGRSQVVIDSIKDARDNRLYRTVKIGEQTWMAENLAYLPYASPQGCGPGGAKCYFIYGYTGTNLIEARDNENYKKYGALYNFEAAKEACPAGWRLPTDEEWMVLEKYLGMSESVATSFGNRGDIGKIMKSTSGWFLNGNGDNSTGLNILPCGFLNEDFEEITKWTYFWSSTADEDSNIWYRAFSFSDGVMRLKYHPLMGLSVRCLKIK